MAISQSETVFGFLSTNLQVPDVVEKVLKMETKLKNNDVLEKLRSNFNDKEETLKRLAYNVYDLFNYQYHGDYNVNPFIHYNLSTFINYLVKEGELNMSIFIGVYTTIMSALESWVCHKDFTDFLMDKCDGSPVLNTIYVEVLEYMLDIWQDMIKSLAETQDKLNISWGSLE
jgi:hypothetical protein